MENPAPASSQVKEDKQEQGVKSETTEVEDSEETFVGKSINLDHKRIRALLKQETLTLDERLELLLTVGEECISEPELKKLLEAKPHPICYDGFEPSGRMHIAQGILKAINVNKCTKSGCTFIFWVADWFALLNNKMDGNLSKIKTVGEYMIEVWKACGMDMNNVKFVWTSDEINSHSNEYWLRVMDIARRFSIKRIMRCGQIMGRKEGEELFASQIFYPCMQCADIFHLKADICQLGLDQRKVNMLAREYCTAVKIKHKPIILSHHMIMGLAEGQEKMSKSNPDSAIFMEDEEADINSKIKKSYCPPKIVEKNPCFDYLKWFVFQKFEEFVVSRDEKNGGTKTYTTYDEVVKDYEAGLLHPGDLKPALAKAINAMIQPVREHFQKDPHAKELLKKVKSFKVTR